MKTKLLIIFLITGLAIQAQVVVKKLRCEMLLNPLGIDAVQPRFSWQLESNQRNVVQISYQLIVSSSEQKLKAGDGDVWKSATINDSKSLLISYGGKPLQSATKYFWQVRVITNKGEAYSVENAFFSTGLLQSDDWRSEEHTSELQSPC